MAGENLSESTRVTITISEWKRKIEAGEITPLNATNYKIVPDPDGEDYGVDTSVAERLTTMDLYNLVSKKANATNGEAGLRLETVFDNPITEVPIVGAGNVTVTSDATGKILVSSSGDSDSHTDDPDQIHTAMPMNLYKMSTSSHGHVHEVEAVTLGDGITMDNTNKIKHTNAIEPGVAQGSATTTLGNGGSFQIPAVRYDAQGHIIDKGTTTMTLPTYSANNGIQVTGGTLISHTNAISPSTAKGSDTFTAENGDSFDIPTVSYDAQGHVTGKGTTTVTLPEFAASDGIKIDEDGLTFKHTNAITAGTAEGTDTSTLINGGSFTTPTVSYDAQGHVTGKGTHTITLPTFAADDGVKIDTDGLTFKHTNNVTPDTASGSATFTADNGDSFDIPTVSYDKHGHVTAKGKTTVTLPTFAADDGIKIDTDGLTFKHTNNVTPGTAKGSEGVTIENGGTIDLPTVTWDKHGHVTGNASTTVTLPEYAATDGIEIDTDGLTFKHTNAVGTGTASGSATSTLANGGSFDIPTVTWDDQGHVTAHGKTTITNPTYAAGDGIKIDTDGLTFKHTNAVTAGTAQGTATSTLANGGSFTTPTVTYDAQGHVTEKGTNTITLPTFKAGDGVKIDTDGLTFKHTNAIAPGTAQGTETSTIENGGSFTTPTVTWDAQGHVTGSGSNTITLPEYAATDGIEIDEDGLTFKHTNAITAGTAAGSSSKTLTNGASFNMPTVNYDAQGHITAKGTTTMTLPTFKAGDGVKIDTDGLTFKHTNAITAGTAQGTATSTLVNGGSFTTPTITYDAQGHITAKGTNTITLPEYAADGGIEIGEDGLTFMHTNNVTAGTASGTSTSTIGNGGSFSMPTISYDKHGHIVTKGTTTITTPKFGAGDGIKLDGLNFKHTNAITAGTASGTATSTLGNGGNFEIPTITYDAQGHITDKGTTKITLPTYTGSNGVTVSGTSITNSGVRSIATGTANGTISVNTNGTSANVAVKGLGSSAYMDTTDTYSSTGTTPTSGKAVAQAIGTVTALMGSNNGIATLDSSGKIPSSQIPGSYDDVLNFDTVDDFPDTGEEGKIYVAKATNTQYRWGGESYIPIGSHLALGETSSTAYRGDRGAVAYTHATDSARNTTAKSEALYAIGITAHGHVGSSTAITAGTGISLASNKISHTNSVTAGTASGSATATIGNGGSFSIPTVSYDAQGHVTGKGTTTITIPTYTANTGIKLNGLTFQHTNAVTAGTASGSATATIGNGGSFSIPTVSYDAQGHVTGKGTTTVTLPTFAAGGGIEIADDGLTFQHTNAITAGTASGSATKTLTFGDTFTIPTVSYDAQGHVTGKGTTTMTMPSLGTSATTAAYGNHTHATSIAASSATNQLSLAASTKYAITAGGTSYVFTTPADTHWTSHLYAGASDGNANAATTNGNTYLIICDNGTARDRRKIAGAGGTTVTSDANGNITITSPALGTGASNAAYGNHTHGITLATDSGTSAITLSPSTKYKLTAGGQSIIFTTPVNSTYTVNNGTLTIQGNGTSLGTFTANQAGDSTINITPGNIGAAPTGHTHSIALAADNGESTITLSPSTKYKLTAGGQSIIFTTPTDHTYTVNNGTLTIHGNGTSLGTFTANQSSASTINITPGNIGAATSGHTHDISIAASSGTSSIALAANTKYQLTAGGKSYIFTTPADTNTWRPVGTGATDAAPGNHTHAISIATSTGTNQITLAHGGKYAITAGGQSYIFTMPADNNTTYSAGIGLTLSGTTFKTKLKSETALTNDSAAATETAGRIYPVVLDKSGYLAVNVPWTDHTYTVNNGTLTIQGNGTSLGTFTANQSSASTINITPGNIGAAPTSHNHDSAYAPKSHTHNYAGSASAGGPATNVAGTYSGNGGQLTPSAVSNATVRFVMMNNPKGLSGFPTYADCLLMDTYSGNDVPWSTGLGIIKQDAAPRMFLFNGAKGNTTTWKNINEVLTTSNYSSYAATSGHTHAISIAESTGTNQITLAHGGKYQITAGGKSYIFTMPADNNTTYSAGTHLTLSGTTFNVTARNNTKGGPLGWTSTSADNILITSNTLAYWNGAYADTSSNLEYCKKGAFGTIVTKNAGDYALTSHGNHVPDTQTANNSIFLRNDNTWQRVTPANIGAATSGHNHDTVYTHKFHYGGTGNTTKIKIKINSTTSWMLSFVVNLYQSYRATSVLISGYQYGNSHWYSPTAVVLGDSTNAAINVYFGYDSANNLWVGFDGGDYTGVSISNVTNGYTQIDNFAGLFTISNVSSLTTLQTTVTAQPPSLKGHTHTKSQITDFPSSMPASDVYAWAKASTKPTYTASEVGAAPTRHDHTEMAMRAQCTTADAANAFHYPGYVTACKVSNSVCGSYTDGMIIDIPWSDSYGHQIYIDDNSLTIGHRYMNQKTWSGWATLLDTNNWSSYAAPASHTHTVSQITDLPTISDSATNSTLVKRTSSGYIFATYLNQSSGAETPTTSSYIIYANSDGYLRKSSLANIKTILGLGSAAYTDSTAYAASSHSHTPASIGAAAASHTHYSLATIGDQRNVATTPNSYSNTFTFMGLKSKATIGSPSDDTYSYLIGLRGWSDNSGGKSHELAFNDTGLYHRIGATTSWEAWKKIAYTSDIPTVYAWAQASTKPTYTASEVGAAPTGHDHTIALAASSGTSSISLAANTKYQLTAGGKSIIFTTPADTNTNNAVTQTATSTNANYEVLFSVTADNTTRTEGARKNSNLTFNPSTGNLNVTQINGVTVGSSPKFTDTNTTYSAGTGISLSGTTFSNSGVRSIATGSSNGTISVNTNGTSANVAVKGLGSAAYTASTAYAAASHDHHSTAYGTQALRHLASGTAAATTTNCPSGAWYGYHS